LKEGTVEPSGIALTYISSPPPATFWRMWQNREFDAAEFSLSTYIAARSRGDRSLVGIPVFPSRVFRHAFIFIGANSGIDVPSDLRGRRVGVPEYGLTAALFQRGMLQDEYGVRPEDIQWFQGGITRPGRKERLVIDLPAGIRIESIADRTIDEMLVKGDLDAIMTPSLPPSVRSNSLQVKRLFPDAEELEVDWYRRTGIYPIMHLIVVRREIHEAHPWVARNLMLAFEAAKQLAFQRLEAHGSPLVALPFLVHHLEASRRIFGPDIWPYGLEANRPTLEAAVRYSHEQGLSARPVGLDELFAPSTTNVFVAS
jgi:4,5-dihydroxyphthalate decarboxylase